MLYVLSRPTCRGAPCCRHPHSPEEREEWAARWEHRDRRQSEGTPHVARGSRASATPISASKVSVCVWGLPGL